MQIRLLQPESSLSEKLQLIQDESALSDLRIETPSMDNRLTLFPLPECLDTSGADVIIQSSDHANFPLHKSILASSSQVFKDMFSLPQPPDLKDVVNRLPVVQVSEKAAVLRALITVLYPIPSEIPSSYSGVLALLSACQKYEMSAIQSSIRAEVAEENLLGANGAEAFVLYAIARKNGLLPEAQTAALLTLDHPLTFEFLGEGLKQFEGWALRDLAKFRKSYRDNLVSCIESYLDNQNGPSKIWGCCSRLNIPPPTDYYGNVRVQTGPTPPLWLCDLFIKRIGELKESFTNPLLNPSSIRGQYLEALRVHTQTSGGCTCLRTHALQGETYSMELEKRLSGVQDEASPALASTFREIS
jgi:BTB/POZ domain